MNVLKRLWLLLHSPVLLTTSLLGFRHMAPQLSLENGAFAGGELPNGLHAGGVPIAEVHGEGGANNQRKRHDF